MTMLATIVVRLRGLAHRALGYSDVTGLTVPCAGDCGDASPHNAHLARGALRYLAR